jgi:membrane protein YqaA with SNARE-associated domain
MNSNETPKTIQSRIDHWIGVAIHQVNRWWYPPLLGALAGLDNFLFVIPTDGLIVASVLGAPKRSVNLVFWSVIGSVLGAVGFAELVYHFGPSVLNTLLGPSFQESSVWAWSQDWFQNYGTWAVFGIAALPLVHHPVLALAILAKVPSSEIALAMLAGRILKYSLLAILAIRAPNVLKRLRPIQKEIEEVERDSNS